MPRLLAQLFTALLQQYGQEVGFLSAREAKLGEKLSVVPASDWATIDPAPALSARFRAMGQGLLWRAPGPRRQPLHSMLGKRFWPGRLRRAGKVWSGGPMCLFLALTRCTRFGRTFSSSLLPPRSWWLPRRLHAAEGGHFRLPSQKLMILQGISASSFSE
jgi:hypothetical protein